MEFLHSLLDWSNMSFFSAFILGLMTAISPCPLATNITAVAYIGKNIENKNKVFLHSIIYTLGRALSYTILGVILFLGASKFEIASVLQSNGEKILGPVLLLSGFLMSGIIRINFPGLGKIIDKFNQNNKSKSWLSALLMGVIFALAFCPYSGVIYFGMLIPMTLSSVSGLFLPLIYAIATGLPVILFAYLIAFALSGVGSIYNKIKIFEKWFRYIVALVFILTGFFYIYIFYFA